MHFLWYGRISSSFLYPVSTLQTNLESIRVLHGSREKDTEIIASTAADYLLAHELCLEKDKTESSSFIHPASTLPGRFRLQVDAAVKDDLSFFTFGAVILNDTGQVVAASATLFPGKTRVEEAEAHALLAGLKFSRENGFSLNIVESDCLGLVKS